MPTTVNPYAAGVYANWATGASSSKTTTASSATNSFQMGKKEFLQLLVAQLKAQNPFTSGEGGGGGGAAGFLGQVTQLATMEQLQSISDGMSKLVNMQSMAQASTLIGRYIETNPDLNGDMIVGTVDQVSVSDGTAWLHVGEDFVAMSDVAVVADGSTPLPSVSSGYALDGAFDFTDPLSDPLTDPATDLPARHNELEAKRM